MGYGATCQRRHSPDGGEEYGITADTILSMPDSRARTRRLRPRVFIADLGGKACGLREAVSDLVGAVAGADAVQFVRTPAVLSHPDQSASC